MGAAKAGVRAREVEKSGSARSRGQREVGVRSRGQKSGSEVGVRGQKSGSGLEFILSQIFFFVIWAVLLMLAKTA